MPRGNCRTPDFVIDIIAGLVDRHGQSGTARLTGLNLQTVQRYLRGVGEPTMETLQKLADFTGETFVITISPRKTL